MTMLSLAAPRQLTFRTAPRFAAKLVAAVALAVTADFLFWERHVGASLAMFAALVGVVVTVAAVPRAQLRRLALPCVGLLLGLLPLAENVSALSLVIGLIAIAWFTLVASNRLRRGLARAARQIAGFLLAAPFRFVPDMVRWRSVAKKAGLRSQFSWLAVWVLPLGLGSVFVLLFGIANPIVEQWLEQIAVWRILELLSLPRIAFWMLVLVSVWGFLRPRISWFQRPRRPVDLIGPVRPKPVRSAHPLGKVVFGQGAILRALTLFNALFAVETVLDIAYLWGGVALPDSMTYAEYAHRGAYPLIVTAVLAAVFVLIATRDGSSAAKSPLIRVLIYLWTAQNVMLVISSILRLDLYVDIYSLTYWRVAAFIWMGLVAVGLLLIIARIALGRPNDWLLTANLATLAATLFACGFVNFAAFIADYNVDHRPDPGDTTLQLDTIYLGELGPEAIPAIDRLLASPGETLGGARDCLVAARNDHTVWLKERMTDWRAWTFRGWRLQRYLDQHPATIGADMLDGLRER